MIKTIQKLVGAKEDGIWGPKTQAVVASKLGCSNDIKSIQKAVGTTVDGILGSKSYQCIINKLQPDTSVGSKTSKFPSQSKVRSNTSIFGKAGDESNLIFVKPPYKIYYDGKEYKHGVKVHKALKESLEAIFQEIYEYYGAENIHKLGLDNYGGAYNFRKTTGGSSYSIHSWGCAIDWAPETNAMNTKAPKATLSSSACRKFWEIWEEHGWHSMGRTYNKDWMHVQACSFN